jgi:pimeloyl-ACP methyl ester carboxylesterase
MQDEPFSHRAVDVGDLRLHVVEAGQGPLVVLLHGFPEFWGSWRHQIRALARAGFRVAAPDMRGYHLSDKPPSVSAYRISRLESDVAGLIRSCGADKAAIVGHDWGGAVAWSFAQSHPRMVERLVILNAPHPRRLAQALWTLRQARKSWYFLFFQIPALPEHWLSNNDFRVLRELFERDAMAAADIQRLVDAAATGRDRLRGPVHYYRAALRQSAFGGARPSQRIDAPVLVIWGEADRFLGKELAVPEPLWVPNARVEFLPNVSHWVQQHAPDRVNALLVDFLADLRSPSSTPG